MAPTLAIRYGFSALTLVKDHILTAMHVGRLQPGDRVLSVRRFSDMTGLNRKTVHRAYRVLEREGFLAARRGSGTYVSATRGASHVAGDERRLLAAVNHSRAEAAALGLTPEVFARFLTHCTGHGLRGTPVAVAECNREQIGMIANDLRETLGLEPRPVLLRDLAAGERSWLNGVAGIVTTDCHVSEVERLMADGRLPVYRLALDASFPRRILAAARRGPLWMVVRDGSFGAVFLRLLRHLGGPPEILARIRILEPSELAQARRRATLPPVVHVSDLADGPDVDALVDGLPRLAGRWRVAEPDLDRLRVKLSIDRALRGTGPG